MNRIEPRVDLGPPSEEWIDAVASRAGGPRGMDEALRSIGAQPLLMNPLLTTAHSAIPGDIGPGVSIPVHIGRGGRKSIYELDVGEKVLAYVLISRERGVFFRYLERIDGRGAVQDGDSYKMEIRSADGRVVFEDTGQIRIADPERGIGEIVYGKSVSVWVLWSCIDVEVS